jgi:hypothetical protein
MQAHFASRTLLRLALPVVAALVVAASCSAAQNQLTGSSTGGGAGSPSGTGGGATGPSGTGGLVSFDAGNGTGGGGTCSGLHCSSDLHSVLDCNGDVVMTCPATEACGGGTCVGDPCTAATMNGSTIGCEFYSMVPGPEPVSRGSCFAAFVANTWNAPITLTVDYGGAPLNVADFARTPTGSGSAITYAPLPSGQLAPGQLAILFLQQGPSALPIAFSKCPAGITPAKTVDTSISGTALGSAFHITASAPVVAYDMYPYGGASSYVASATLLVPTAAWGTNYIAADGWAEDPSVGDPPFIQIIAAEDATHVTISPTSAIVGGTGVAPAAQGMPATYTLDKGQVLQLEQTDELAGSPITSDNPVSVWGGASCMNIPVGVYACDSAHQELLPVMSLGHEYVAARYRDRVAGTAESPPWTLVGAVDGTTLTYDPAPPPGAPTTLASRQVVSFDADAPFTVSSQDSAHPFYLSGHMTGHEMLTNNQLGDAETVNVVPPAQYLDGYLFLTDPTYANTHLVLVRGQAPDGTFKDVTVDCAGTITGWAPVGNGGRYQVAHLDLVAAGVPNGTCNNGVHTAASTAPFGLTVWGWDVAVSYAYPAGMSTLPINTVMVPASIQ